MSLKAAARKVLDRNRQRNSGATGQHCCRNSRATVSAGADGESDFEERAAIIEFDGELPRKHAEAAAAGLIEGEQ